MGTLTAEVVDSFKIHSFTDAECVAQRIHASLVNCTGVITQNLPESVLSRIVMFSLSANMNASMSVTDPVLIPYATRTFDVNSNSESASQIVVTLKDIKVDPSQQPSSMTLRSQPTTSLSVNNVRVYPILPEWYFTNRWYEYLYAVIAPVFLPGASGVCTADSCLRLHYVRNGVAGQRDNLPALIFTRRSPATYQLDPEEDSAIALDFMQPVSANTGLVLW